MHVRLVPVISNPPLAERNVRMNEEKVYEVGYLLLPSIPEESISTEVSRLKETISKSGGNVKTEGTPEKRALAYEMTKNIAGKNEKFSSAYFGWIKFTAEPSGAVMIKKELDSLDTILRFILIKSEKEVTQTKKERRAPEARVTETRKLSEAEIDKSIDELIVE